VGKRNLLLILIVLALMGFLFQAFATQRGIGLSIDSAAYIWAARNLDRGLGLVWDDGHGGFTPMILWPPLYPSALAAIGLCGVDPLDGARWLNGVLFAGSIFLAGAALYAYSGRKPLLAGFGAALVLVSPLMIQLHAMAWSEPLCLFFGFLSLYLLARYLDDSSRPYLLASAVAAGLAFLTRYPGAAFIWAALLGLCFLSRTRWVRRISDAILFGLISCLPVLLWLARNVRAGGSSTGRAFNFHPMTGKQVASFLYAVARWVIPDPAPGATLLHNPIRAANLLLVAAGLALACFLAFRRKNMRVPQGDAAGRLRFLPHLLIAYVVFYGAVLAMTFLFLDAQTEVDSRILSPLCVASILLGLCAANWLLPAVKNRRALATLAVLFCAAFGLFYLISAWRWAGRAGRQGEGFRDRAWQTSGIIGELRKLPPETIIYSNNYCAIYILADRVSCDVPNKYDGITLKPNARYAAEIADMSKRLRKSGGVFVFFKGEHQGPQPSEDEIKAAFPGAVILQEREGRIYRLGTPSQEVRTAKEE
jgi:4-amino-4-deoxy-L-arabinose transferase-like glycosyltransferase